MLDSLSDQWKFDKIEWPQSIKKIFFQSDMQQMTILSSFLFRFKCEFIGPCSREALSLEERPQLAVGWLSDASVPVRLLHSQLPAHRTSYVLQSGRSIDLSNQTLFLLIILI